MKLNLARCSYCAYFKKQILGEQVNVSWNPSRPVGATAVGGRGGGADTINRMQFADGRADTPLNKQLSEPGGRGRAVRVFRESWQVPSCSQGP